MLRPYRQLDLDERGTMVRLLNVRVRVAAIVRQWRQRLSMLHGYEILPHYIIDKLERCRSLEQIAGQLWLDSASGYALKFVKLGMADNEFVSWSISAVM